MRHGFSSYGVPRPDIEPTFAALKQLDVFPGATDDELRRIAEAGHAVSVPQYWALMAEQTPADKAYVVLSGTASVRHGADEFATVGVGEFIGELAIVNHKLRSATVVAATPLELLHLTREAVEELREEIPAFRAVLDKAAEGRVA